ncbi:MAG: cache domain-containing protein [Pseudobutyrivibrio sp.]|nr:cache domain-containing protein [Pseudobutyrivibrio sp.]
MAKKEKPTNNSPKVKKSIGKTLLMILLPIIAIGIAGIIVFISYNARQVITEVSLMDLQAEGEENARQLGSEFQMLTAKFGQYCDTLEQVYFEDHDAMLRYIEPSIDYNSVENSGIYVGLSDDSYFFADHATQPDGWLPTQRDWYQEGVNQETFVCTEPYLDATTNTICVTFVRNVNFYNGEFGVAGVDVYLTALQEDVNALTPMNTGGSMVLAGDYIISYFDPELNGTLVSESGSTYLEQVKSYVESGSTEPIIINQTTNGND